MPVGQTHPQSGGLGSVDMDVSSSSVQTKLDVELGKRRCIGPPKFTVKFQNYLEEYQDNNNFNFFFHDASGNEDPSAWQG